MLKTYIPEWEGYGDIVLLKRSDHVASHGFLGAAEGAAYPWPEVWPHRGANGEYAGGLLQMKFIPLQASLVRFEPQYISCLRNKSRQRMAASPPSGIQGFAFILLYSFSIALKK